MAKKIIVIGGGPAGYTAAIRAAQLGAEVTLAEESGVGGTCLQAGCIPTKALLRAAEFYRLASRGGVPGVKISGLELDWTAAQAGKQAIVDRLTGGVEYLLRRNGVTLIKERAVPLSGQLVEIGEQTHTADAVILAAGSVNRPLSFPGDDLPNIIDSTAALSLERLPESILIAGGGVVGVEFATLFASLGVKTTIIELIPRLLPSMDPEISAFLEASLTADGIAVHTGARLAQAEAAPGGLKISFDKNGETWIADASMMLVAAGRKANTEGLNLDGVGALTSGGVPLLRDNNETMAPGLYAVGDCSGGIMLAHAAMAQGTRVAERVMGAASPVCFNSVPSCVYSSPEIASAGLTENALQESETDYVAGRFDLAGNAKSMIDGGGGFVKILAGRKYGEILGVHIVGPHATELIAEASLCMNLEGTADDLIGVIRAHPTVCESIHEAALSIFGSPIHG